MARVEVFTIAEAPLSVLSTLVIILAMARHALPNGTEEEQAQQDYREPMFIQNAAHLLLLRTLGTASLMLSCAVCDRCPA
jgi:hypothetical protein